MYVCMYVGSRYQSLIIAFQRYSVRLPNLHMKVQIHTRNVLRGESPAVFMCSRTVLKIEDSHATQLYKEFEKIEEKKFYKLK